MKKICVFLVLSLLLLASSPAFADGGVSMEVMIADGVSVVVLTPELSLLQAEVLSAAEGEAGSFQIPKFLTLIEDSAFEGIGAVCVEISENVAYIGYHAFANCKNLREFHIPASVKEIDREALAGCRDVTVYGATDVAKAFAEAAGFSIVDPDAPSPAADPIVVGTEKAPVELPLVRR